jgi:hypothetical protein
MNSTRRRYTIPLAIVAAAATLPLLTGCFGNPVQGLVKAATGGKVDVGGNSLPADFPKSIKVYSGKIDYAIAVDSGKKEAWNVTVEVPNLAAAKEIETELKGSGLKVTEAVTGTTGTVISGSSSSYSVIVAVSGSAKKWIANYTVGPSESGN